MKDKLKSYKFWLSLLAGVIVLINTLGAVFNFKVNEIAITSIATAVLGILVILGFVKKDTDVKSDEESENTDKKNDDTTIDEINNHGNEKTENSENSQLTDAKSKEEQVISKNENDINEISLESVIKEQTKTQSEIEKELNKQVESTKDLLNEKDKKQ